jgi:H+/gluconate symporter-like permease
MVIEANGAAFKLAEMVIKVVGPKNLLLGVLGLDSPARAALCVIAIAAGSMIGVFIFSLIFR